MKQVYYFDNSKLVKDNEGLLKKCEKISSIKEKLFADKTRLSSDSASCFGLKKNLEFKIDSLISRKEDYKMQAIRAREENFHLKKEIKKQKAYQYDWHEGFAVVRDEDGMAGYLRQGGSKTEVSYIYRDACRFSNGRAFVKAANSERYGFVDKSLGKSLIPARYEDACWFEGDFAMVKLKGKWIWINKQDQFQRAATRSEINSRKKTKA